MTFEEQVNQRLDEIGMVAYKSEELDRGLKELFGKLEISNEEGYKKFLGFLNNDTDRFVRRITDNPQINSAMKAMLLSGWR